MDREVAGDLRCDALGGRIAAQRGHGFVDALVQLASAAVPDFIRRAAFLQDGPSVAEAVSEIIDQAGDPVAVGLGGGGHGCKRAQKIRGAHHVADNLGEGRNVAAEEAAFAGAEAQEGAHLGRGGREIVQCFGQTGVVAAKDGAGLTGGVRQFAEAQAELGDKIAVGVAREDEALHDHAGDDAEQHFFDAGEGEGPRHVRPRLAARGDDDVGQSGQEKRVRRTRLAEHCHAKSHDDEGCRQIEQRRLLPRPGGEVAQHAADDRADHAEERLLLQGADILRHDKEDDGQHRPIRVVQPQELGAEEGRCAGQRHLQSECRRTGIEAAQEG